MSKTNKNFDTAWAFLFQHSTAALSTLKWSRKTETFHRDDITIKSWAETPAALESRLTQTVRQRQETGTEITHDTRKTHQTHEELSWELHKGIRRN